MANMRTLIFASALFVCLVSLCAAQEVAVDAGAETVVDSEKAVDELSTVNFEDQVSELENLDDTIDEAEVSMFEIDQEAATATDGEVRPEEKKYFKKCWVVYKKCCKVPYSKKICHQEKCCKEEYKMVKYQCGWLEDKYDDKHDGYKNYDDKHDGYGYKPKKPKYCTKKKPYRKCWKCEKCYKKWFFNTHCSPYETKYIDMKK